MITEQDLQEAIAECEGERNPKSATCIKLAAFYTLKDHMYPKNDVSEKQESGYFADSGKVSDNVAQITYISDTLYGKTINGLAVDDVLSVMDELMDALIALEPRLYDFAMRKIKEL